MQRISVPTDPLVDGPARLQSGVRQVVERVRVLDQPHLDPEPWLLDLVALLTGGRWGLRELLPVLGRPAPGEAWTLTETPEGAVWFGEHLGELELPQALDAAQAHLRRLEHESVSVLLTSVGVGQPPSVWLRGYFHRTVEEALILLKEMVSQLAGRRSRALLIREPPGAYGEATGSREAARERLAEAIQAIGLSAAEAAAVLGVSRESVRRWLQGESISPENQGRIDELWQTLQWARLALRPESLPKVMRRPVPRLGGVTRLKLLLERRFEELREDFERLAYQDVLASAQ